ncbi:MAG: hypothetical protein KY475_24125 [Planctomycetes bacterium]|nr:hypothetical protein [Planctomycetota bacterium]
MISFSRLAARQARGVFRRALGLSTRGPGPPVTLAAEDGRLVLRAVNSTAAVQLCLDQEASLESPVTVPFELLSDCEGGRSDDVALEVTDDGRLKASWSDKGVPQMCLYEPPAAPEAAFPAIPKRLAENGSELLIAIREAMATTDPESVRFALGCIQFRGGKGEIAATDSRELLILGGFKFPWKKDLLVRSNPVFGSAALLAGEPVQVGRTGDWLMVETGPWRVFLVTEKGGRFPEVDHHVQSPAAAKAVVRFSEADAAFLAESLPRLPGRDEPFQPATLDVNGEVCVRAAGEGQPPTELLLTGATHTGKAMRLNTNRAYLARALSLGFREIYLFGPGSPILCQDERRSYVWAVLESEGAIDPNKEAVRIASPAAGEAPAEASPINHKPRKEEPKSNMPRNTNGRAKPPNAESAKAETAPDQNGASETVSVDALIEQAEGMKNSLRTASAQVSELIAGLKRHRKNSRTLQTALSSIRQSLEV